jgi:hypothetical protein
MELINDKAHVEAHFCPLEMLLILTQDTCTVCAKHTIGSKIILDALMVLLGDEAQAKARFGLCWR